MIIMYKTTRHSPEITARKMRRVTLNQVHFLPEEDASDRVYGMSEGMHTARHRWHASFKDAIHQLEQDYQYAINDLEYALAKAREDLARVKSHKDPGEDMGDNTVSTMHTNPTK
jgi:hypothetical protein